MGFVVGMRYLQSALPDHHGRNLKASTFTAKWSPVEQ